MLAPPRPQISLKTLIYAGVFLLVISLWLGFPCAISILQQAKTERILRAILVTLADPAPVNVYCQSGPLSPDQQQILQQAWQDLKQTNAWQPATEQSYLLQARVACMLSDWSAAEHAYQRYTQLRPDNPLGWIELGFFYQATCLQDEVELGGSPELACQPEQEAAMLHAWQAAGLPGQDCATAGQELLAAGEYQSALRWYQCAQALGFESTSQYFYCAYQMEKANQNSETAYTRLEQAILADQGWSDPNQRFNAWFNWGQLLYFEDQFAMAEVIFEKVIQIYPDDPKQAILLAETYRLLGGAQWLQGNLMAGEGNLRAATQLNRENIWAFIHHGKILYEISSQNLSESLANFQTALAIPSATTAEWANIIGYLRSIGETKAADSFCQRAEENKIALEDPASACPGIP